MLIKLNIMLIMLNIRNLDSRWNLNFLNLLQIYFTEKMHGVVKQSLVFNNVEYQKFGVTEHKVFSGD